MVRGSDWHKNMQKMLMKEYEELGYSVSNEKRIGFEEKVTIETQFKQVDIVVEKRNETILIEIEDLKKKERELGVGYVELGGILFLSYIYTRLNPNKNIKLLLVFRNNIESFRKENIERIINEFGRVGKIPKIEVQYRP